MVVEGENAGGWMMVICDLIEEILSVKKVKKDSHFSTEAGMSRFWGAPTTRSIVLKRVLGLRWLLEIKVEKYLALASFTAAL